MADRYYGAPVGANLPKDVTEAATTTSAAVEVRITTGTDVRAALIAIDAIKRRIQTTEKGVIG